MLTVDSILTISWLHDFSYSLKYQTHCTILIYIVSWKWKLQQCFSYKNNQLADCFAPEQICIQIFLVVWYLR